MRILFLYPRMKLELYNGNTPPVAVLSLASFMKREGHDVKIYERNTDKKNLSQAMECFEPDVVVCTLTFANQVADMRIVCQELRAIRPDTPILCGGLMASLIPEMILQAGLADFVGIGEGEYTLMELLEVVVGQREPSTVQSLVYLDQNGQPVHTSLRPFADLSEFPDIDFSLLPMNKYFSFYPGASHTLMVYSSKGCPSQCTFCVNPAYHRCKYRLRCSQSVMREIETLVSVYGANGIFFLDELWGLDKEELRTYCSEIAALSKKLGKPIRWGCETRFGTMSFEDLKLMADSGCWLILFGLESGSPEILNRIKKRYPLTKVESDINNCKLVGISTFASVIFGFPDETPAQIKQTVHTLFRLNPSIYGSGLFYASPGSAEYNELVSSGKLIPAKDIESWSDLGRQFLKANYSATPDRDLKVIHCFFYWRILFQDRKDHKTGRLDYIKLVFKRILTNIGRKGFFHFIFENSYLFLYVFWYTFAFPGIRKKYDLYARNFGRKDWDDLEHLDAPKPL